MPLQRSPQGHEGFLALFVRCFQLAGKPSRVLNRVNARTAIQEPRNPGIETKTKAEKRVKAETKNKIECKTLDRA